VVLVGQLLQLDLLKDQLILLVRLRRPVLVVLVVHVDQLIQLGQWYQLILTHLLLL